MGPNHTTRSDRLHKVGETDFGNRLTESWSGKLGGTDSLISVGPKRYERETENLHCNLGGTDRSSRFDRNITKRKQGVYIAISVGPIAHLGGTETL